MEDDKLVLALPKGRILDEVLPLVRAAGIEPEEDFFSKKSRALRFKTNHANVEIIRVRSFDVATFVAFGAAQIGVCGSDVIEEFGYPELYAPVDLDIGHCRISVAEPVDSGGQTDLARLSSLRIATKYPNLTRRHFEAKGVQVEVIKLNGAMELAPTLGLCQRIVDLVSTGTTLKANGLVELDVIEEVSSRLIVNRGGLKTRAVEIQGWIDAFARAKESVQNAA
jgi:ATP phosphoribosyltransferase